jgi:hypothetical protein
MTAPVTLHASEIRPRVEKSRSARHKPLLIVVSAVLGVVCSAALFMAVGSLFPNPVSDQPGGIRFGRVDWPEIKNGVPEVAPSKGPIFGASVPSASSPDRPGEEPDSPELHGAQPGMLSRNQPRMDAEAVASAEAVIAQLRSSDPVPPVEIDAAEFLAEGANRPAASEPDGAAVVLRPEPTIPSPAAASNASVNVEETGALVPLAPASVPLPPRRPKEAKTQSRVKPVNVVDRKGAAHLDEEPVAETRVAAAGPVNVNAGKVDERVRLLGIPLPSFIPNGRRIKDCVLELRC